jgi:hypothetical protein
MEFHLHTTYTLAGQVYLTLLSASCTRYCDHLFVNSLIQSWNLHETNCSNLTVRVATDLISHPNPSHVTDVYRNYPPCSFPSPKISNFGVFLLTHVKGVKLRSLLSSRINHRYWNESNVRQQQIAENMYIVYGTHSFRMSENNKCWI